MAEHQIAMSEIDLLDDGEITKEDHFMPEGARDGELDFAAGERGGNPL